MAVTFDALPVFNTAFTQLQATSNDTSSSRPGSARKIILRLPPPPTQSQASSTLLPTLLQSISLLLSPTALASVSFPPIPLLLPKLPVSLETLYQACKTLVLVHGKGEEIYERFKLDLERGAVGMMRLWREEALANGGSKEGDAWVEILVKGWEWWSGRIDLLRSILLPLDRSFVLVNTGTSNILDLSREIFKTIVFENSQTTTDKTSAALLSFVAHERDNGASQTLRPLFHTLATSLLSPLSLLSTLLLPSLKESTTTFYTSLRTTLLEPSTPIAVYLRRAEESLSAEEDRLVEVFGLSKDSGGIVKIVENVLITQGKEDIIKRGISEGMVGGGSSDLSMEVDEEVDDGTDKGKGKEGEKVKKETKPDEEGLTRLMRLLRRVGSDGGVKPVWGEWVRTHVEELISDPVNDDTMVQSLLTFRTHIFSILAGAFSIPTSDGASVRDRVLAEAANNAFQNGMSKRRNKPAEMIAKSLDQLLRSRTTSAATVSSRLDDLLTLVRFTRDKDVFKAFYVTGLAKRLLLGRTASDDAELGMVDRLKKELGDDFTTGDGMMADLNLSTELMKNYRSKHDASDDMDLSVSVLSNANWPSYPDLGKGWEAFALPPTLNAALDRFKQFYTSSHQGRLLSWRYQLFTLNLKARFPLGTKDLSVSLYQAMVLLLFNDVEEKGTLGWSEIKERTGIETDELRRTLQSLACGRIRVLSKHPAGKDVKESDTFSFNHKFEHEKLKLKVNQIQQAQSAEEDQRTETRVLHDRSHLLDAAIVRIMKSTKTSTWNDLTNLCVEAVRRTFPPEPKMIKQQIESLIEREYLARDDEDPMRVLHYLA
ncbi:Cullin family-domain-containing protein [Mrakia frigida]|uniref:cullin family protein n=1 Tax=Mrakia frigida TaxID=29902 RepID=UPI003FCBF13E